MTVSTFYVNQKMYTTLCIVKVHYQKCLKDLSTECLLAHITQR